MNATQPDSLPHPDRRPANILVVENNIILRFTLSEWLRSQEYNVLEAASAEEAMTILGSLIQVDMVITDIHLPGEWSGLDLADHLYSQPTFLPVIAVSSDKSFQEDMSESVAAFFVKPYDFQEIANRVRLLLHRGQGI